MSEDIRVDQLGGEAIGRLGLGLRVNQLGGEAVGVFVNRIRVDQAGGEVVGHLAAPSGNIRVDQLGGEALGILVSPLRVNQMGAEVIGPVALSQAFVIALGGNMALDTYARVHLEDTSAVLVDSGAWLRVRDGALLTLAHATTLTLSKSGQLTIIGTTIVRADTTEFIVQGGTCAFGATAAAVTDVMLGNGADSARLAVYGTLTVDDDSSLILGTISGATGPAALEVGRYASLALVNASFALLGTLDIEGKAITITGAAPGDGVVTTGGVLADFTMTTGGNHTGFFVDASYKPTTWAWTFGDGNSSGLRNPTYEYAGAGSYVVTLTVSGAGGASTITKTVTVP